MVTLKHLKRIFFWFKFIGTARNWCFLTSSKEILALSQVHLMSNTRVYYFLRLSISICPSVHPSVRPSVHQSVGHAFLYRGMGQKCSENIMQLTLLAMYSFIHSFIHAFRHIVVLVQLVST